MTHPLMVANKFPLPFSFFTLLVKYNYLRSRASPIRFAAMHHYFHDYKILSIEKIEFTFIHSSLLLYYNLRRKFQNILLRNSRRKGSNIPFNSFVKFFLFPARTNFPPKLSLSLSSLRACARACKLSARGYRGNKRVLSRGGHWSGGSSLRPRVSIDAVRFYQSCRPRPRRHQIILFIERKRSLNRRARYAVYLLLRLVVFLPPSYPSPFLFQTSTAFTTRSFLSLSPFFSSLGTDSRSRFSALTKCRDG